MTCSHEEHSILLKENQQLKKLLITANTALKERIECDHAKDATLETIVSKVANIERERREEKVTSILVDILGEGVGAELIEIFSRSGMVLEDIHKVLTYKGLRSKK